MAASASPRASAVSARLPAAFWALFAGQLINRLTTFVHPFLVLYLTRERGVTVALAGAVVAAVGVGNAIAHVLGGVLADRVGRRATMLIGFFGASAAMVGLGLATALPVIVVCSLLVGVTGELFRPASSATVADMLGPESRVRAYGLLFWAVNLGFAIATTSAGFLAKQGFGLLFWLDALGSAIAGIIIWRVVPETRPAPTTDRPRSLLRVAGRDRLLIVLAAVGVAYAALYMQAYSTLPLAMAADRLPPSAYGIVIAVNGVVIVLLQPFAIKVLARLDRNNVLVGSMLLVGVGFGLSAFVSDSLGYGGSVAVWTLGEIGFASVIMAVYADLAPADLRGGYLGIGAVTWSLGGVIGPLAGTFVLERAGSTVLWTAAFGLGVAVAVAQAALGPALRRRVEAVPGPAESTESTDRAGVSTS